MRKGTMEDLVSIIIPVYNVGSYLSSCLTSVINQTYHNLQVILVDDGSSDCSGEICDDFAAIDHRILVVHRENGGASAARNQGIMYARGRWVFFLDGDDLLHKRCIEILVQNSMSHDIVLVDYLWSQDAELDVSNIVLPAPIVAEELSTEDMLIEAMTNKLLMRACGSLITDKLAKKLRFIEGRTFEDLPYFVQMLTEAQSIAWIKHPLYIYRRHGESVTHTITSKKKADFVYMRCSRAMYVKQGFPNLSGMECAGLYSVLLNMSYEVKNLSDQDRELITDAIRTCRKENPIKFFYFSDDRIGLARKLEMIGCMINFQIMVYLKHFLIQSFEKIMAVTTGRDA